MAGKRPDPYDEWRKRSGDSGQGGAEKRVNTARGMTRVIEMIDVCQASDACRQLESHGSPAELAIPCRERPARPLVNLTRQ
jgi:hypothetical protein